MGNFMQNLKREHGQSLVEMAISLPLFLILIVGVVEVGNLLVAQQRVTTAADMGTRFGSRGGTDEGMLIAMQNTLTQTLPIGDPDLWDVFVVRGTVNEDGTGIPDLVAEHVYGSGFTENFTSTDHISFTRDILTDEILNGLKTLSREENGELIIVPGTNDASGEAGRQAAAGQEIVGMIVYHDVNTILGLDSVFDFDVDLTGTNYMRIQAVGTQSTGCSVYPIIITNQSRSIEARSNEDFEDRTLGAQYPAAFPTFNDFDTNFGNRLIIESVEGDLFVLAVGSDLKWLDWDGAGGTDTAQSLAWPGNSGEFYTGYEGFLDPDPGLHRRDRVYGGGVTLNNGAIQALIDAQRPIRIMIGDAPNVASSGPYIPDEFIVMRLHGYGSLNGQDWILAETVRVDRSCGQILN